MDNSPLPEPILVLLRSAVLLASFVDDVRRERILEVNAWLGDDYQSPQWRIYSDAYYEIFPLFSHYNHQYAATDLTLLYENALLRAEEYVSRQHARNIQEVLRASTP